MTDFSLPKIQIYVTTRCNLNCKLCGTYCPYLKNPHDVDYNDFEKDVTHLFDLVYKFDRIELTGGEPILNPHLPKMIDFLSKFSNRSDEFRLISNGRELPSDILLKAIQKMVNLLGKGIFKVLLDDYGPDLSVHIKDAESLYKKTGATVEVRDYHSKHSYMGGWLDYGVSSELKRTREQVLQNPKCTNYFPMKMKSLFKGVIYTCGRGIYYYNEVVKNIPQFPNCVLLHEHSKSPEQHREELYKFWNSEYFEVCSYCNCKFPQDTRRFPPAEQLL